jgi:cytochrome b561
MEYLRYSRFAMALHWLTAVLVVALFSLAHIWDFFPHNGSTQRMLQTAHVSLGVILAAVVVVRLIWRIASGRHIPPALQGFEGLAARAMHYSLYILLIVMAIAGFGKRWAGHHGVEFFGLSIPSPMASDPAWRHDFGFVHHWGAWVIITFAALHAAAALYHHFIRNDGLLRRMLPER